MKSSEVFSLNNQNLIGKTIAITGATGVIGKELCQTFANLNANLILLNRNVELSEQLKQELLQKNPNIKIDIFKTDLENLNEVINTCNKLKNYNIDFLILNAGAYKITRKTTDLGFDNIFQINFISQYYLVKKLIPNLSKSNGKVITVGSIAHKYSKINIADVDFSKCKTDSKTYGNAKRFLMFSLFELLKQHNINYAVAHPGITLTNITRNYPKIIKAIIKYPMKILFLKPEDACKAISQAVFKNCKYGYWIGPKIFNIWGKPAESKIKTFTKTESEQIYDIAEKIYTKIKLEK